ncbi:hypothetical protein LZG04_11945 [Saccharothrix sp. S26]|uniref:hypothetical protein n=1 Tax=Saccharothrix sp. S26 TaxID=2907215 RepID=UPI001F43A198|nr:hypothetical protein [Saccharothrix sp. S26]MCE6995509.1 hypothetical protein [Saccharothrix sp. S26]
MTVFDTATRFKARHGRQPMEREDYDRLLAGLVRDRPHGESPLSTLRHALRAGLKVLPKSGRHGPFARTQTAIAPATPYTAGARGVPDSGSRLARALAERTGRPVNARLEAIAMAAVTALATSTAIEAGDPDPRSSVEDAFDFLATGR